MMKNIICLTVFCCSLVFTCKTFATEPVTPTVNTLKDSTSAQIISKFFPEDTVQRFIKNLGKDSLIILIDKGISDAQQFILKNSDKLKYDNSIIEYILVADHFKLKIDYKSIDTTKFAGNQFRLYGLDFGNIMESLRIIDTIRASGKNMLETLKSQSIDIIRYSVPLYCEKLTLNREIYDLILANSKKLSVNDQLKDYLIFAELNRRCKDEENESVTYQKKLFEELFPGNNPKVYFTDTFPKNVVKDSVIPNLVVEEPLRYKELEDFYTKHNPLRMLAYSLYANDVNINNYSDNLIYLLDAQQKNGSWTFAKKFNYFHSDPASTLYAVWALCEFREKLKKW